MPMGMAPIAHVLWSQVMKFNPSNPKWANRDRFVLSNGHGCALLYIMLHLTGYDLSMDDLKNFRQLDSKTPGHPEAGFTTPGIEVTTGPLGQGIANAVGLAIAQRHMAAVYNKPDFDLFDNMTWVFCGDGCLQEGVSSEASSLAGHLGLGNIVVMYDDNQITIDGETDLSFTEDVGARYESYGWQVLEVADADTNLEALLAAINAAKAETGRPTIIKCKTTIGWGSVNEGQESTHGSPLAPDDIAALKTKLGFDPEQFFTVPEEVSAFYGQFKEQGATLESKWNELLEGYKAAHPDLAAELTRRLAGDLPAGWEDALPSFDASGKANATRSLSGNVLNAMAPLMPELVGGSADLTPSNKTQLKCSHDFQKGTPDGRYLRFGVREHAMGAIGNGLAAYGGFLPFTATFFNFLTYMFPAVRLAALSHQQQIFVMTHDSIFLGEDGPTHQPVECLALCRATPNLLTFRPCDGNETSGAYKLAVQARTAPSVLALTRQNLPQIAGTSIDAVAKGAYVVSDGKEDENVDVILVATGSEVALAVEAAAAFSGSARVVSMPCAELFDAQSVEYRRQVLTPGKPVISIEAGTVKGWERYAHASIGLPGFGASAPFDDVCTKFGFTTPQVLESIQGHLDSFKAASEATGVSAIGLLPTHL